MARRNDGLLVEILTDLMDAPWWLSPLVAATVYVAFKFLLPGLTPAENPMLGGVTRGIAVAAGPIACLFLVPAPIAYFNARRKKKQLDAQTGLTSIRALPWKQFEELIAEAYRRQGYAVTENTVLGPDGGVDIHLSKDGQHYLVQAKHWKTRSVGVKVVREMYGVLTDEGADGVIIVTSGNYTKEATRFAQGKPIDLVDGPALAKLIRDVRSILGATRRKTQPPPLAPGLPATPTSTTRTCPRCGSDLVTRTARRGQHAGRRFIGCSGFPRCRYTRDVD